MSKLFNNIFGEKGAEMTKEEEEQAIEEDPRYEADDKDSETNR